MTIAIIGVASFLAIRWAWRDITYWSRSVTVEYETDSLEACVRLLPEREDVIVKSTDEPQVARIVVFGHSESVSRLGPPSEEDAAAVLRDMKTVVSERCTESPALTACQHLS